MRTRILRLLQGSSVADLAWLMREEQLRSNFYTVVGPPFVAHFGSSPFGKGLPIPWFILLTLGRTAENTASLAEAR